MSAPHVVHVFPAFSTGGPEVRTCTLINALGDEFRHTVVSLNGDTTGASRLAKPDWIRQVVPDVALGPTTLLAFGRQLRHLSPGLLITYGWGGTDALFAALLQRINDKDVRMLAIDRNIPDPLRIAARKRATATRA